MASGAPAAHKTASLPAFLAEEGFDTASALEAAREALHLAGLTNPRKGRIIESKLARCRAALRAAFARSCGLGACDRALAARHPAKSVVRVAPASCEHCGGAANRRAGIDLVARCEALGIRRILVVGGAPAGRRELRAALAGIGVDLVDGNAKRDAKQANAELARADVVVIWGNTALAHSVSELYRRPPAGVSLVLVAASGAASVLAGLRTHLAGRRARAG